MRVLCTDIGGLNRVRHEFFLQIQAVDMEDTVS